MVSLGFGLRPVTHMDGKKKGRGTQGFWKIGQGTLD